MISRVLVIGHGHYSVTTRPVAHRRPGPCGAGAHRGRPPLPRNVNVGFGGPSDKERLWSDTSIGTLANRQDDRSSVAVREHGYARKAGGARPGSMRSECFRFHLANTSCVFCWCVPCATAARLGSRPRLARSVGPPWHFSERRAGSTQSRRGVAPPPELIHPIGSPISKT